MNLVFRNPGFITATAAVVILSAGALRHPLCAAFSQPPLIMDHAIAGYGQAPGVVQHHQQIMQIPGQGTEVMRSTTPSIPGQNAFGAIQEIVRMLEADPNTDWRKVDLEVLRQHLIDMNKVRPKADAAE